MTASPDDPTDFDTLWDYDDPAGTDEHEAAATHDGYVDEETGDCLWLLGRQDEAKPYFARALAELSKDPWLAESEPARLARLKDRGDAGSKAE